MTKTLQEIGPIGHMIAQGLERGLRDLPRTAYEIEIAADTFARNGWRVTLHATSEQRRCAPLLLVWAEHIPDTNIWATVGVDLDVEIPIAELHSWREPSLRAAPDMVAALAAAVSAGRVKERLHLDDAGIIDSEGVIELQGIPTPVGHSHGRAGDKASLREVEYQYEPYDDHATSLPA